MVYVQVRTARWDKDLESGPVTSGVRPPGFHLPGVTPSWFYSHSKSPGAGAARGRSLYLPRSVPGVFIHTCCLSTSYMRVRGSTCRSRVRGMAGWATVPRGYRVRSEGASPR